MLKLLMYCQVSMVENTTILVSQASSVSLGTPYFCMHSPNPVVVPSRSVSVPHFCGHPEMAGSPACLKA